MNPVGMPPSSQPIPEGDEPPISATSASLAANSDTLTNAANSLSTEISINSFFRTVSQSRLDFKANLREIEFSEADFSRKQGLDALSQVSNAFTQYNKLLLEWKAQKVNLEQSDTATEARNSQASQTNQQITGSQQQSEALNQETESYNSAVEQFNEKNSAGFSTPAERDTAIAEYNLAVERYNFAIRSFNADATSTNASIAQYNAELDRYNAQIEANNEQITQENIERTQQGKASLPYQEREEYKPLIELQEEREPLRYEETENIEPAQPVETPTLLENKTAPSQLDFYRDYLSSEFIPFFLDAISYMSNTRELAQLLLSERVVPNSGSQDITRPNAYIDREEIDQPDAAAGISLATLAMGLDSTKIDAILGLAAVKQLFEQQHVATTLPLLQLLQPFTLSIFVQTSIRGAVAGLGFLETDPFKQKPSSDALRVASSLGGAAALLGAVQSGGVKEPLLELLTEQGLSSSQREALAPDLENILSSALLKLSISSLAIETDSPKLTGAIEAALLANSAQPTLSQKVREEFSELTSAYGADTVALLLTDFIQAKGEYDAEKTQKLNALLFPSIEKGALPAQKELDQAASTLERDHLTSQIALFTLGAAAKDELQSHLISKVGPQHASSVADETLLRTFGFSIDFSEPAIIERSSDELRPQSSYSILQENMHLLHIKENNQVGAKLAEEYSTAHKSIYKLESFLREVIDPGQVLIGLMYENAKGATFERGWLDIPVG